MRIIGQALFNNQCEKASRENEKVLPGKGRPVDNYGVGCKLSLSIISYIINCITLRMDGIKSPLRKGTGYVDCRFARFPLAAGEYYLGVGVTHTMVRVLCQSFKFGRLRVAPYLDAYSQRALTSDIVYFSVPHTWYQCHGGEEAPVELKAEGDG